MRVALHSVLVPGGGTDYDRVHARVPADLRALFDRAGIREWTIWRSGEHLFHVIDCEEFETAMAVISVDPANERWQADIGRFVQEFHGADGAGSTGPLREVWSLAAQRAGDPTP